MSAARETGRSSQGLYGGVAARLREADDSQARVTHSVVEADA